MRLLLFCLNPQFRIYKDSFLPKRRNVSSMHTFEAKHKRIILPKPFFLKKVIYMHKLLKMPPTKAAHHIPQVGELLTQIIF